MGPEELPNRMVEALGSIMDRRPKGRPRKMENQTIEKIGYVSCILTVTYYLFKLVINDYEVMKWIFQK